MNIECEIIQTEKPFDWSKWKSVKKFLKEQKFDLVHAHGTRAASNIIWAAGSLNIPVIYTVHGWSFHPDQSSLVRNLRILGEKYLTGKTNKNISVSVSNQQSGRKYIPSFNSVVVNNGIDQQKFNPQKERKNLRPELGIGQDVVVIAFIARFTVQKQPLTLIRAFAKALTLFPHMHLLMVGEGDQRAEAIELASAPGIKEHITLLPFRQDVPDILAMADIFVLPSLWEGLPIGLLEAMAMGKAVIASDADGTREVIQHNENGILVSTDDLVFHLSEAIVDLASNQTKRKRLQETAVQTISEHFNAGTMTRKIESIYTDIAKNRSSFKQ